MLTIPGLNPIDYLLIGHITQDLTPMGPRLGGAVSYAARTTRSLGLRTGIVTAWGEEISLDDMEGIGIVHEQAEHSTTFENIDTPTGREQFLHHVAPSLDYYQIPEIWRSTRIVHLAPVAQEVNSGIVRRFPDADLYLTPQGWLRQWDQDGRVYANEWPEAHHILRQVKAAVISENDYQNDPGILAGMIENTGILAVTLAERGVSLFIDGQELEPIPAPVVEEIDSTGAGDIFAAVFFAQLSTHGDPVEAATLANQIAADSVTRFGLDGTPGQENLYPLSEVY